jgi:hypothetical protein
MCYPFNAEQELGNVKACIDIGGKFSPYTGEKWGLWAYSRHLRFYILWVDCI